MCITLEILVKKILALSLMAACSVAAGVAQAQTADIKLTGKILPAACQAVFGGGGEFDFGKICACDLDRWGNGPAVLDAKIQRLDIICGAATKIAVKVTDNRSGTAAAGTGDGYDFGLGGKNTGSYNLRYSNVYDEIKPVAVLTDANGDGKWAKLSSSVGFKADGSSRKAFAPSGTLVPGAYRALRGELIVQPILNKRSELDIGSDIDLDGSATLELVYL